MLDGISRIEILFQIPVNLTDEESVWLDKFSRRICDRHQPEGWVYWPSGHGSAPIWREPMEPDWDDAVYQISTCAREAYPEEIERDRVLAEKKAQRRASLRYRAFTVAHASLNRIADLLYRMENGRWQKR